MKNIRSILIANSGVFEIIKNITEIIALLIGASWALYNFELKDAPALENAASSYGELHIDSLNKNKNLINYILHLKNIGKSNFDVDSVHVSYWLVSPDTIANNIYFLAEKYMERKKADYTLTDDAFSYRYTPEKECIERYNFFLNNKPDCAILIKADFFIEGRKGLFSKESFQDNTYTFRLHMLPG
jgi:hypothetical protein